MTSRIITVEECPNVNWRRFCITVEISKSSRSFWSPLELISKQRLMEMGKRGATLVKAVLTIPGVYKVEVYPDFIYVAKNVSYTWEIIEPRVIEALKKAFGRSIGKVEVLHP